MPASVFQAGQVQRPLGVRVDGTDDLAVFAEILNGAGNFDVQHAWLVTGGRPSVDGACGLVARTGERLGPVAPVVRFTSEADDINWANDNECGLDG